MCNSFIYIIILIIFNVSNTMPYRLWKFKITVLKFFLLLNTVCSSEQPNSLLFYIKFIILKIILKIKNVYYK